MLTLIFFVFGLIIGSFLNVVVLRAEKGVSIGGRSHCPACQALIHWHDNLPVISYLFLWGRCRSCRAHISLQYPLVELLTGVTFALIGGLYFASNFMTGEGMMMTAWYLVLMSIMIAILVADLRTMEIPLMFLVAGVAVSLFFILLLTVLFFGEGWREPGAWWQLRLLGGAVAAFLFWLLVFFSRETWMGMGDVWLAGIVGLVVGIESLLFTLTLSFLVGALVGIALLVSKKKGLRSEIPFAPFLVLGLFLSLVLAWINPPWLALFILPL